MSDKTKELPAHIGGYQKLEPWVIVEEGDVWVRNGAIHDTVSPFWFGHRVDLAERSAHEEFRIYRKMPLPRNHCEVDWDKQDTQFANSECKAKTDDAAKPPLAHLPWGALDEVAMVQSYGHQKYGDFYNYKKGMEVSRNISCAIRHLRAYMNGEDNDPESARPHLAHAACRILFALQNIKDGKSIDDRFKR